MPNSCVLLPEKTVKFTFEFLVWQGLWRIDTKKIFVGLRLAETPVEPKSAKT